MMAAGGSGALSRLYSSTNAIYIKNLSPLVTRDHINAIFSHCDEIVNIQFKPYANSNQCYCVVEFKSSAGITAASQLNNTPLLNVPMTITVIEPQSAGPGENVMLPVPGAPPPPPTPPPTMIAPGVGGTDLAAATAAGTAAVAATGAVNTSNPAMTSSMISGGLSVVEIAMQNHMANLQAVQAAALQAKLLADKKKTELGLGVTIAAVGGQLPAAASLVVGSTYKETELQQLARTLFIQGFSEQYDENELRLMLKDLGKVSDLKISTKEDGQRFALAEFETKEDAGVVQGMDGRTFGTFVLTIKPSESIVTYRDPDGVLFDVPAPPILNLLKQQQTPEQQQVLHAQRMELVEAAKNDIEKRLMKNGLNAHSPNAGSRHRSRSPSTRRSSKRQCVPPFPPHHSRTPGSHSPASRPSASTVLKERLRRAADASPTRSPAVDIRVGGGRASTDASVVSRKRSASAKKRSQSRSRSSSISRPKAKVRECRSMSRSDASREASPAAERVSPGVQQAPVSHKTNEGSPRQRPQSSKNRSPDPSRRSVAHLRSKSPPRRCSPPGSPNNRRHRRSSSPAIVNRRSVSPNRVFVLKARGNRMNTSRSPLRRRSRSPRRPSCSPDRIASRRRSSPRSPAHPVNRPDTVTHGEILQASRRSKSPGRASAGRGRVGGGAGEVRLRPAPGVQSPSRGGMRGRSRSPSRSRSRRRSESVTRESPRRRCARSPSRNGPFRRRQNKSPPHAAGPMPRGMDGRRWEHPSRDSPPAQGGRWEHGSLINGSPRSRAAGGRVVPVRSPSPRRWREPRDSPRREIREIDRRGPRRLVLTGGDERHWKGGPGFPEGSLPPLPPPPRRPRRGVKGLIAFNDRRGGSPSLDNRIERYKSQSRSLSDDAASPSPSPRPVGARGSNGGMASPCLVGKGDMGDGYKSDKSDADEGVRKPTSALPLSNRLGALRERLQNKRAEESLK